VLAAAKPLKAVESPEDRRIEASFPTVASANSTPLETLFREHQDRVFRTAYRVTGSASDAEDVLQTVFLRIARDEQTRPVDNPQAYFARAAINASLDLLRRRKRSNLVAFDEVEADASEATPISRRNPEADHEDRELRTLVRNAVARLGPTAGQMFALRYFEGFDNGEIARIMKTSALVVGVTLHRARARLRKEIGEYLQGHSA
jgi:RNA polymerase sigma-70 factor (ECF subfamily)